MPQEVGRRALRDPSQHVVPAAWVGAALSGDTGFLQQARRCQLLRRPVVSNWGGSVPAPQGEALAVLGDIEGVVGCCRHPGSRARDTAEHGTAHRTQASPAAGTSSLASIVLRLRLLLSWFSWSLQLGDILLLRNFFFIF